MRLSFLALSATLFLLPACEDETTMMMMMMPDMAAMQMQTQDMSVGPLSCSGALRCYNNCSTNQCFDDCYERDTPKAKMLDDDFFYGCPARLCSQPDDAGVAACTTADVAAAVAGDIDSLSQECGACMDTFDPASDCPTELAACQADR